jgi:hypothetical protein
MLGALSFSHQGSDELPLAAVTTLRGAAGGVRHVERRSAVRAPMPALPTDLLRCGRAGALVAGAPATRGRLGALRLSGRAATGFVARPLQAASAAGGLAAMDMAIASWERGRAARCWYSEGAAAQGR